MLILGESFCKMLQLASLGGDDLIDQTTSGSKEGGNERCMHRMLTANCDKFVMIHCSHLVMFRCTRCYRYDDDVTPSSTNQLVAINNSCTLIYCIHTLKLVLNNVGTNV